jgi:predicted oxidoreductase
MHQKNKTDMEDNHMKQINLGNSAFRASEIVMGCMRIDTMNTKALSTFVDHALDEGINLFDHADIYGNTTCETLFGEVLHTRPGLREKIKLQTKCSIRSGYYDLSKDHIINSVDESLKRLQTDYIDLFILHRPDTLMEPDEIAQAFDSLLYSGKVLHFGVSNFSSMQIEMLKMSVSQPILVNQMQFGIMHTGMIDKGFQVNTTFDGAYDRDGSILEYCRINNITLQAWSPFQYGFFEGHFIDNPKFPELNEALDSIAKQKNATKSAIALAWILRHPAKMQAILGTTNPKRLHEICVGTKIELTREEWYAIYRAAGNILP